MQNDNQITMEEKVNRGELHQISVQRLVFTHVMLLLKSFSDFSIHCSGKLRTLQQTGNVHHFPGLAIEAHTPLFSSNSTIVSSVQESCVSKRRTEVSFFTHHLHTQPPKELIFTQGSLKHSPKDCSQWNKQTNKQTNRKDTCSWSLRKDNVWENSGNNSTPWPVTSKSTVQFGMGT